MPSPSRKASPGRKGSPSRKGSPKKLTPEKPSNARLYKAAAQGDIDTVKKQIVLGADVDWTSETKFEHTPLIAAAQNGHANVVEALILAGADLNKPNKALETPIFKAAKHGNLAIVEMLIFYKADVNRESNEGYTPLHEAAFAEQSPMNSYIEIIQLLLDNDANINAQNQNGTTPLHAAASRSNEEIVFILLKNGANINIQNQFGQTAGQMARIGGSDKTADMIENWRTISTIAMLEHRGDYNKMDLTDFELLRKFMGGKRTMRGKQILGRKTRSNRRRN
jgi:ankyrin repeat protein